MSHAELLPGFADPVREAASAFRVVLDAMARPGRIREIPTPVAAPDGLSPALAAVALCLLDGDTPLWIDDEMIGDAARRYLSFHTGAPIVEASDQARFAMVPVEILADVVETLNIGTAEYPDRSATVIARVTGFDAARGAVLSGPGIETETRLSPGGMTRAGWSVLARNAALYPLGIDTIFVSDAAVACLPRSTTIRMEEE
jgi:alpha-D-ribose 1-methylphosphonate 5-triphosphate synthase subunit PhnH